MSRRAPSSATPRWPTRRGPARHGVLRGAAAGPTGCRSCRSPSRYLEEFLATTGRDPAEVLIPMPHLNKNLTVRLAAINAALAGCLPEYLPVVLAAWDAFRADGMVTRSIWQSTTGTAPFIGADRADADRDRVQLRGATCSARGSGPTPRIGAGDPARRDQRPRPQAARARPGHPGDARPSTCAASRENEEDSPWSSLHADYGFAAADSAVDRDRHPLGAARRGAAHDRARAAGVRTSPTRCAAPARWCGRSPPGTSCSTPSTPGCSTSTAGPRPTCGRRSPSGARAATGTCGGPARRRSPAAPAGGCPSTTRRRCRRRCSTTWTPRSG